ncbi:MAG TPA: response regulator [Myxococcota bacterium]
MTTPTTSTSTLTALVVDDKPESLSVLVEVLSRSGFRVLVAEDGEAALETVVPAQPDVIFLDINLPGIDGFETARRLRASDASQEIPILFVTALDRTADRVRGFAAGGVDYVTKPFRADEVLSRARAYAEVTSLRRRVKRARALLEENDVAAAKALLALE